MLSLMAASFSFPVSAETKWNNQKRSMNLFFCVFDRVVKVVARNWGCCRATVALVCWFCCERMERRRRCCCCCCALALGSFRSIKLALFGPGRFLATAWFAAQIWWSTIDNHVIDITALVYLRAKSVVVVASDCLATNRARHGVCLLAGARACVRRAVCWERDRCERVDVILFDMRVRVCVCVCVCVFFFFFVDE